MSALADQWAESDSWFGRLKALMEKEAVHGATEQDRRAAQRTLADPRAMTELEEFCANTKNAEEIDRIIDQNPEQMRRLLEVNTGKRSPGKTHHRVETADVDGTWELLNNMGINVDDTLKKPDIEGVYAYHKAWDAAMDILGLAVEHAIGITKLDEHPDLAAKIGANRGFGLVGAAAEASSLSRGMAIAHPITFDPEQYAALPDWDTPEEAIEYAEHVKLPFDVCWFDLETPLGSATRTIGESKSMRLNGALVSLKQNILSITPIYHITENSEGPARDQWMEERKVDPSYWPGGTLHVYVGKGDLPDEWPKKPFKEYEKEVVGTPFNIVSVDWEWFGIQAGMHDPDDADDFMFDLDTPWTKPLTRARLVTVPFSPATRDDDAVTTKLAAVYVAAIEVLKILFFLDTPGIVELAQAQVSRQVRRAAERSGAKIAQTIYVRQNTKRYERNDNEEHIEFSHRFEVRGHWKYFPKGTKMADARPDLLRHVPGRGLCRKIWCPPFVKGPEDKPLVMKTRRVREEDDQDGD